MTRILVYTAVIGTIDKLWSAMPGHMSLSDVGHVALVDEKKREVGLWGGGPPEILRETYNISGLPTWEQTVVPVYRSFRRTARHYKTLPHRYFPDYDYWIWVDGNVRLRLSPRELVELNRKHSLVTFKHPDRNCLYQEARFCARFKKDDRETLQVQLDDYKSAKMPVKWGLAETRVVVRKNTPEIRDLNELWWAEIEKHSKRDQVSLPYACWKLGLRWKNLPGTCAPANKDKRYYYIGHTK